MLASLRARSPLAGFAAVVTARSAVLRLLSPLVTVAALTTFASAQCFESNLGVLMPRGANAPGVGDDVLFDLQPLNFTFPMGGVAASYTHAHVQTNGVIFLTNGAASGATTTGYASTAAAMVTNLRGTATQPPRIAPYWRDLNILAANGGGVYFNNTIPGKFVVTWNNAVHFGQTTPVFSIQAQIFSDGSVSFFYNGVVQNTAVCPIVGLSQGAAVADPGGSDLSAGASSTTQIVYETFPTLNTFDLQSTTVTFAPNLSGGYDVSSAPCTPLANDECITALAIVNGANGPFSNSGANTSLPAWPCGAGGADVWFNYTATCFGNATIDTCGSAFDTVIEVFSGTCASLSTLGCNDDSCGLQSSITFPTLPGTTYRIRVGGFAGATGSFSLNVGCSPVILPNDECTGAIPVFDGPNGPFSTLGATTSSPWPCALGGSDLWYSYVATCCGNLTVETCGGSYDTALQIFDGSCGGLVSLACNDDACSLQSRVIVPVIVGTTYYIRLGGYNGARGTTPMTLTCTPVAPANDECAGAVPITAGPNGPFQNLCASTSAPLWGCAAGGNDVWFSFTATCSAPHTFRTCGASFDTAIEVFDGSCGALVSLGCNDDAGTGPCAFTLQSSLTVSLVNTQTYYIRVGGFFGDRGTFPLDVTLGTGTGAFTTESPGCGPTTLTASGDPNIGGTVNFTLGNLTNLGPAFIGFGFVLAPTPFCVCTVGHDWSAVFFANNVGLTIPCDPSWIGVPVGIQGAEFEVGGCPSPLLTFTDTIRMTIG